MRNFAISVFGRIEQTVIVNAAPPTEFGLPPASEPDLTRFSPEYAVDDGEPDLFRLLRWDYGLVETLYGRDKELGAILDWAGRGGEAATVRLVTGEGGAGKTRLAAEAALRLRAQGWTAGFLPRRDPLLFEVTGRGLFLILDYPEEQIERTRALFAKLAELKNGPYPIRLLLLSRRRFEQWEQEAAILEGRFGRQAVAAPGALSVEDSQALVAEAARRFAAVARQEEPDLTPARQWLVQSPLHALPLFAMAAAIHAVLEPQDAFGLGGGQLIRDLAQREHRRAQNASRALGLGDEGLARLLALGVLADGLSQSAVKELADAGAIDADARNPVDFLSRTPWWRGGRLIRLQPDRPAAAFLDLVLFPPSFPNGRDDLSDWLFIALAERAATFGDRLGRMKYDLASLGRSEPDEHPLDRALIAMIDHDPARAQTLESMAFEEPSPWSAPLAAQVTLALASQVADPLRRAYLLINASNSLCLAGRDVDALRCANQAEELLSGMSEELPVQLRHALAMSLNNGANALAKLGQSALALQYMARATELLKEVHAAHPTDKSAHDLGRILTNLARRHLQNNSFNEACKLVTESIVLFRALAYDDADLATPDLVESLICSVVILSNPSRIASNSEVLSMANEAVERSRELARIDPHLFTDLLCRSIEAKSAALVARQELSRALESCNEVISIYRELAPASHEVYAPRLASALQRSAHVLLALDSGNDAYAAAEEAVRAIAPIFLTQPAAFAAYMPQVLDVYVASCGAAGREPDLELLEPVMARLQEMA